MTGVMMAAVPNYMRRHKPKFLRTVCIHMKAAEGFEQEILAEYKDR